MNYPNLQQPDGSTPVTIIANGVPVTTSTGLPTTAVANRTDFPVAIASGASLSAAADLGNLTAATIFMPAAWTSAVLTFQVSSDGTNFFSLYDAYGVEVSLTASASTAIRLYPSEWAAYRYIKVRSGTSATPVNQGAARTLIITGRSV